MPKLQQRYRDFKLCLKQLMPDKKEKFPLNIGAIL